MKEYHKIQTVFKRSETDKFKTLIEGEFSLPVFEYLQNNPWVFTEKVDGTNIRVMITAAGVVFGGKTDNAQIPAALVQRLREMFGPVEAKLRDVFPDGACLYGEGYGAKIQNGGNYSAAPDFVLFDVKVGQFWLERHNVEDVAAKCGVRAVPIIGEGTLHDMVFRAREGITSQWGDFRAEGIVARPKVEIATRNGERVITKIKTRDFTRAR